MDSQKEYLKVCHEVCNKVYRLGAISEAVGSGNAYTNVQNILKSFSVSDAKVADILAQVRAALPTTEALLIGKPQAGQKLYCARVNRRIR